MRSIQLFTLCYLTLKHEIYELVIAITQQHLKKHLRSLRKKAIILSKNQFELESWVKLILKYFSY
jgi:hypothetical protein